MGQNGQYPPFRPARAVAGPRGWGFVRRPWAWDTDVGAYVLTPYTVRKVYEENEIEFAVERNTLGQWTAQEFTSGSCICEGKPRSVVISNARGLLRKFGDDARERIAGHILRYGGLANEIPTCAKCGSTMKYGEWIKRDVCARCRKGKP